METIKLPFYAKAALICIGIFAFGQILFIAQSIIVPVIFATILAIVMSPVVDFLVRKKMNRVVAIAIVLLLVAIVVILLVVLLSAQISVFATSFPGLIDKFYDTLNRLLVWISANFNIRPEIISSFLEDTKTEVLATGKSAIGATLTTMGNILVVLVLIPVYIFMILFYQPLLLEFIRRLFGTKNQNNVNEILTSTKTIIQKYLIGLLIEAAIIASLNAIGLLIINIDYAIVLGIIGAILNVIPYIGGVIAVALPMMVAFSSSSPSSAFIVLAVYLVIQFVDNHFIIPKIVASKVKINALISIIVVLIGGALWGISGMFLSIPLTAIIKVIFDHIEDVKPWGYLLGDIVPTASKYSFGRKNLTVK